MFIFHRQQKNVWGTVRKKKPFFALAPMADATDNAFREIIVKKSNMGKRGGGPDIMWTEFVACDGLASEEGRPHLLSDLAYTKNQRPIVAQIFGGNPDTCFVGAKVVAGLGFDGVDINMGCPQEAIIKQHAGADLIRDPKRAKEIVEAVREGVKAAGKNTPVSVKTRVGFSKDMLEDWIPELLSLDLPALTIHARTRKDMSKVPARWERVARTVELRDTYAPNTLIIGNGDVVSVSDGIQKAQETGADGIMIGRAVFGNPWIFSDRPTVQQAALGHGAMTTISTQEILETLIEHTKLYEKMHGNKNFAIMKKHYSAYVRGFQGAKELRTELMNTDTYEDVYNIAGDFLGNLE
jgi:nifR3 family TIM-barrel protein